MMRPVFFLLAIFMGLQFCAVSQQPVAGIQCTVTPAPNYSLTKNDSKVSSLTDGVFSSGISSIWKDPGTLGWQNIEKVVINITLPRELTVGSVNVHSVTGQKAQVLLPLSVLVFTSEDQENWSFAGDMMKQHPVKDEYYKVVALSLDQIGQSAKYIKLVVVPNGSYFFTDEIQVFAGNAQSAKKLAMVATNGIDAFAKQQREGAINQRFAAYSAPVAKSAAIATLTLAPLNSGMADMNNVAAGPVNIYTMKGLTEYAAFVLSNGTGDDKNVHISFPASTPAISYQLYWAKPVKSRDFRIVPDALEEIKNGADISVAKGESKLLLVKAVAANSGTYQFTLTAGSLTAQANITAGNGDLTAYKSLRPDVNVWPYFNDPFFQGREAGAKQDLLGHYVNTFLVHPGILAPDKAFASNQRLQDNLAYAKGFRQALLFLDFSRKGNDLLSDSWKQTFLNWYDAIIPALQQQGITADNIYLYPFDEIKPAQLPVYQQFADWIRSVRKNAKLFATVSNAALLNTMAAQADAIQLYNDDRVLSAWHGLRNAPSRVWLYDTKKPTKSLSPNGYYRLMAWHAFAENITGIGFWQYADVGHEQGAESVWDDFDGKSADYAVVYDEGSRVIPSRRWEGFRMGVEDYMLLQAYSKRYGRNAALRLCNNVLSNADDPQKADQVRAQIVKELGK
ncbi:glycoside hydrolase domain-containing protein [Chitinophaga sp. 212800010-3]|uniref:glycoside hydrolase domain-containing protein n=1 Tax=unclassified Chitinophaga TaxID=2619133 RepID=UPI002DEDD74B|nr:F5/8 type C domain-containing protein [Chitinophaga sp. 212800010-3]